MPHDGDATAGQPATRNDAPGEPGEEPPSSGPLAPADHAAPFPPEPFDPVIRVTADPGVGRSAALGPGAAGLPSIVAAIDRGLHAAVAELAVPVRRLAVRLVDDAAMTALHDRHCGIAGTTDVLSFPEAAPGEPVEADIACCLDEAARQSAARGHAVAEELLLYAVHGLLHCLGHDDHEPEAYARMHAEEDRILTAIGVGVRFATTVRDAPADEAGAADGVLSPGVAT